MGGAQTPGKCLIFAIIFSKTLPFKKISKIDWAIVFAATAVRFCSYRAHFLFEKSACKSKSDCF